MPITNGVFANVAGATNAFSGQIIQSAVWNNIHSDYSTTINELLQEMISLPTYRNIAWMNGGFEVWQRGAGSTASIAVTAGTTVYTADRWYLLANANQASVVSAQTGLVDESQVCARVQRNSGQTGVGVMVFAYPLDLNEIIRMQGNVVTLSFRIRAGANWSPASGAITAQVFTGTGAAAAKRGNTPYAGEVTVLTANTNLTPGGSTTLVQITSSVAIPANATQAEIQFAWTPVGTAGVSDYFEVDDLQLEPSVSSQDFVPTHYDRVPLSEMLSGCKTHYQKTFQYNVAPAAGIGSNASNFIGGYGNGFFIVPWDLERELRTTGGVTFFSIQTATASSFSDNVSVSMVAAAVNIGTKRVYVFNATTTTAAVLMQINIVVSAGI